jgi:tetratricopeptide (TPR) repeat protein
MSRYLDEQDTDDETGGVALPPVDPEAQRLAIEEAVSLKGLGNTAFGEKDYDEALKHYSAAVKLLKDTRCPRDALILLNRSATFLALKRFVPALYDATQAAEVDPDNWKAHWRQGVALLSMTKKKFRTQQAKAAFEACLKCSTLPADKRDEVTRELSKANALWEKQDAETPPADLSNCAPS